MRLGDLYITKESLAYTKKNWKMIAHLLFRTKFFGVNNTWWGDGP